MKTVNNKDIFIEDYYKIFNLTSNLESIIFHPPIKRRLKWFIRHPMKISYLFSGLIWSLFYLTGIRIKLIEDIVFNKTNTILKKIQKDEKNIDDTIHTIETYSGLSPYTNINAQQAVYEIKELINRLRSMELRTVVEIGTAEGGTLYLWSNCITTCKTLISMDLPGRIPRIKRRFYRSFNNDVNIIFIEGNSHDSQTINELKKVLRDEMIDFLFIDGDHSYHGVKEDFHKYKRFIAKGGIIALHDIKSIQFGVRKFWDEIKEHYEYTEIVAPESDNPPGIGIVYL